MKKAREATDIMVAFRGWTAALAINESTTDEDVDALLPRSARRVSRMYWTPVRVARRAAQIFEALGASRVLDVGSGAGKFCVVAGARAPRISFVGIEQRPHLVATARSLAVVVGAANVAFVVGDATALPWTDFDGFYVFNSFAENSFHMEEQLDQTVELSHERRMDDIMRVERGLARLRAGTALVTYHGLGGPIPRSYECVHAEIVGNGWLRGWKRGREGTTSNDTYWLEDGADVRLATLEDVVNHFLPEPDEGA